MIETIGGPVKFVMVTVPQQSSDEHLYLVFLITLRKGTRR